jgi:hypothetical protein
MPNVTATGRALRSVPTPTQRIVRNQYLTHGSPLLDLATLKDFMRFHIHTSESMLKDRPTTDSMRSISRWNQRTNSQWQNFNAHLCTRIAKLEQNYVSWSC